MRKIFYIIIIGAVFVNACVSQNKSIVKNDMNKYVKEWAEIEQLRRQGLPQSMLTKVDAIYREALSEKNCGQLIKALIFRINSMGIIEENDEGANEIFRTLKKDAEMLPQPAKSIVYSMIAQMYEEYYIQNGWVINRRTSVMTDVDDVHTWDARRLSEEAVRYYRLSLYDRKTLQNEPIGNFGDILLEGYDTAYQLSLYDLLAKRALAYFSSSFNVHSLPQQVFVINDPSYFADAREFATSDIQTADSLSPAYLSLEIYQELLRFHIKKSNYGAWGGQANDDVAALIDVDLRRIAFLRDKGIYADNDKLYENALIEMGKTYKAYTRNVQVLLQLGNFYLLKGDAWRNDKTEENKAGYVKAYHICEQIENEYPGQPDENLKALKDAVRKKEMNLRVEESQLSDKPFLALLKYRNMNALYQITYKLSEQEALDYMRTSGRHDRKYRNISDFISSLRKEPERKQIKLPESSDFQYYTTEIKIDPLEKGLYLILFADTEYPPLSYDVWTSVFIQASSLAAYDRTADGVTTVMVTNRETGEPAPGAKITMYNDTDKYSSFISDENGMAKSAKKSEYHVPNYYDVTYNNDKLLVFNISYDWRHYTDKDYDNAVLFTDRSIYRPGQTVYFKAILFCNMTDGNRTLLCGKTVNIRFRDVNRQIIAEKTLTSNDFGSVDGNFTIPQGLLNGHMTIECSDFATVAIRVEEYKRPTFEVKFNPVGGNFALNEQVEMTANAKALAGYAIDHADVRYRVVRSVKNRYLYRWYPPINNKNREIASGVLKTDEKGDFSIEFKALADDVKDDRIIYTYTVTADVTDVNGETRSASVDVQVGNKPLLVNTNLPDEVSSGKLNDYTVETTNLNGDFTPASVRVEIISLKRPAGILRNRIWKNERIDVYTIPENEFRKYFPFDAYGDELNPANFEELGTIAQYAIETENNKKLDLTSLKQSGYYKIKLTADNRKGVVVENIRYVYLSGDKLEKIDDMDKWIKSVKTTVEPGENAEFMVAGGAENTYVYCELIHKDRIVDAKWIKTGTTPSAVTYPVGESHRGGFALQFSMIQNNRKYSAVVPVTVLYTNKMLDVELATFRDKLLPGENETWTMKVSDKKGDRETAEIVASLYDASLDEFSRHRWPDVSAIYFQHMNTHLYQWNYNAIEKYAKSEMYNNVPVATVKPPVFLTDINWFDRSYLSAFYTNSASYGHVMLKGRNLSGGARRGLLVAEAQMVSANDVVTAGFGRQEQDVAAPAAEQDVLHEATPGKGQMALGGGQAALDASLAAVQTRTNFEETAFFYPNLRTNEQGETLIEFTIPEALTRWRLLSFAHTKDFKIGSYTNELITRKQVAISANPPRFFRENDIIVFTAKINNLTESELSGQAMLRLYDAETMQPVDAIIQSEKMPGFSVKTGESAGLRWELAIPEGLRAITYKVTAQAGTHADGEEKTLPVLTNSMLVTETLPFSIRAGKEKNLLFDRFVNNRSTTLRHHRLTLEFTSAPAWYAVQALPYIMEYPYECAEQTFSRYYANMLATTIVNKMPRIRQVFDLWKTFGSEALMSNMEKNRELKQIVLEETPWLAQAKNETERKKRIGLLFDLNRMSSEMSRTFNKLKNIQNSDGGFPWFEGQLSNRYITQHIVAGMAHLEKLDAVQANHSADATQMMERGLSFLDKEVLNDHEVLIDRKSNLEEQHISSLQLHYLYACSFSGHQPSGKQKEAFDFYLEQAGRFWKSFSTYDKAMAALVLHRNSRTEIAAAVIRSLKEYAQQSEELGMYWKDNVAGYFWYQAPVETQAMLIEAFDEVASDRDAVEEMKIWLLRNKQTNDWKTTKATSEAIYALLMTGSNLSDESTLIEVKLAGKPLAVVAKEQIKPEPGTGYVRTSWQGSDIIASLGNLNVKNPNGDGIAWGGMYWQYFERLDKITMAETNLKMKKQLFLRTLTSKGETLQPMTESDRLKVGDLVRVRMELRVDRDYEYVHLKDMRAAGLEPVSTRSGSRYQDGLWYYESVKDASINFFIHSLPKGVYVFEYDLRVSHAGDFSNGITTFQCMYAPELGSHSEGIRLSVASQPPNATK
ncbi:MAG: hypothetical protein LBG28_00055 [Tannerella sp.]|jgi:uncharacterized protein YfaS (alpha-2-macroglobulin family)|nr:hypothetical protein [Tannerella sp.]